MVKKGETHIPRPGGERKGRREGNGKGKRKEGEEGG